MGLRAIPNIGRKTAQRLRDIGIRSRQDLADADVLELADLKLVSHAKAETFIDTAAALVNGSVLRTGDGDFPDRDPIFIDIETDGLTPTTVWLIGILDRAGDESYMSFLQPILMRTVSSSKRSWTGTRQMQRAVRLSPTTLTSHLRRSHCPVL